MSKVGRNSSLAFEALENVMLQGAILGGTTGRGPLCSQARRSRGGVGCGRDPGGAHGPRAQGAEYQPGPGSAPAQRLPLHPRVLSPTTPEATALHAKTDKQLEDLAVTWRAPPTEAIKQDRFSTRVLGGGGYWRSGEAYDVVDALGRGDIIEVAHVHRVRNATREARVCHVRRVAVHWVAFISETCESKWHAWTDARLQALWGVSSTVAAAPGTGSAEASSASAAVSPLSLNLEAPESP